MAYESLNASLADRLDNNMFSMGTFLRELIQIFDKNLLVLFKLLLLEKKVCLCDTDDFLKMGRVVIADTLSTLDIIL
jgi:hypothetical protein